MNNLMSRFGGMGLGGQAPPAGPSEPQVGQVFQVGGLSIL